MIAERTYEHWKALIEGGIKPPVTEAEYVELLNFMNDLTDRHDINEHPWSELFGLVAKYMHEWELENEPELKFFDLPPHEMLGRIMKARGVTQYALEQEGIVNQSNLSKILRGERGISKALAKRLSKRFNVNVDLFL